MRHDACARTFAALVALACAAVLPAGVGAAGPFTPKAIAGTWTGTWTNETFGSMGPAKIVARSLAGNTKLVFTVDFGGNVFGCEDPPPESAKPLTKGTGPGHWNAAGFQVKGESKAFGNLKLTYRAATGALTGGGANPTCAMDLQWTVKGRFVGKAFTGTVTIKLARGAQTATSALSLKRVS
jgi:hypothetical protein